MIAPDYLARRSALIQSGSPTSQVKACSPKGASTALADGDEPAEHGTSHIAVVDDAGTMISYTSTIESAFGSGLMVDGFYLNNELTDFSRSPTVDGKPVANRVEGGKRGALGVLLGGRRRKELEGRGEDGRNTSQGGRGEVGKGGSAEAGLVSAFRKVYGRCTTVNEVQSCLPIRG